MEKRVREVRSEEVRLRGALEQREREAIAHLREVSWKYVDRSLVWLFPGAKVIHETKHFCTLYKPSALFMVCILCVVQVLSDLEMKVEGLREEEGRLRVACQERERQRAALEADTLTSDPLREVERETMCVCVCWVGTVEKEGVRVC